jgi:hypothetical protein
MSEAAESTEPAAPKNYRRAWCAIHGEPNHLQRAVCHSCLEPLDDELHTRCWHPAVGDYAYWRCWEGLPR